MQVEVTVERIGETNTYGANGFRKRELVGMTDEGEYSQPLLFEFVQDKTQLLDQVAEGEQIIIDFNLRGNRWQPQGKPEKIFVSLQGWKIEKKPLGNENPRANSEVDKYQANNSPDDDPSDLPF